MRTGWDLTYQHGCVVMVRAVSWVPFSRRECKAFRGVLFSSQCQDWLFICFVVWWRTCWKQGVRAGIGTQVPSENSPSGRSCWIRSPPQAIKSGPYRIWDSAVHRVLPHFLTLVETALQSHFWIGLLCAWPREHQALWIHGPSRRRLGVWLWRRRNVSMNFTVSRDNAESRFDGYSCCSLVQIRTSLEFCWNTAVTSITITYLVGPTLLILILSSA